ncbi:MAG: DUF1559 domain-containing protein [Pirellulales bacterium]
MRWRLSSMLWTVTLMAVVLALGRWCFDALNGARHAARQSACSGRFCQITVALHSYHDVYGCFPPSVTTDAEGRPMHSWRVLLLPYLEHSPLYNEYRFDEPWDSPHNRKLEGKIARLYRCLLENDDAQFPTNVVLIVGPGTAFPAPNESRKASDFRGTKDTIWIAEVADSDIHWMSPVDLDVRTMSMTVNDDQAPSISSRHPGGALVGVFDGCAGRFLPNSTKPEELRRRLRWEGE